MVNSFDKVFMGAAGTPTGASDDEFNRVSFLSHFEGANNGVNNAFDDGSASNHTVTAYNNVTQGSFGPFARPDGEWAAYFDGTGDYLSAEDDTNFSFGTGDFTIECWLFRQDNSVTFNDLVGTANNNVLVGSNRGGWVLAYYHNYGTGNLYAVKFGYQYNNSFPVNIAFTKTLNTNTWYHLAITRQGNQLKCFVDGTQTGSTTTNSTDMISTEPLTVGTGSSGGQSFIKGSISNVRVVKGTAVYTSNFTPPTAPLTAITNTKLLTCQSNRFVDNSASALTVTPSGNTAVTAFGPFLTSSVYDAGTNGASAYLDGSSDYVTIPQTTDMDLSGDFTVECWAYFNEIKAMSFVNKWGGSGKFGWILYHTSGGTLQFYSGNSGSLGSVTAFNKGVTVGQWYHIAVARTGNTLSTFVNGVRTATATVTTNNTSNAATYIGTNGSSSSGIAAYGVNGYLSDVRIIKGTAAYNGTTYTVPTAPLTAVTNTKLLLNMADAQVFDSAAQLNMPLIDDAKLSNAKAKFGNTSLLLDGSGKVHLTGRVLDFGAGDFTAELFINITTGGADEIILEARNSNDTSGPMFTLQTSTSDKIVYIVSAAARITSGSALSTNTWYHIAVCRSGTSTKLFIDGTQAGSTYSDSTVYTQPNPYCVLGGYYTSTTYDFDGYIDEVRITKGFARYTSNFTAPTEPFADKGQ